MKSEAPRSASSEVVNRSGRPSPLKSSKMLPPARFGPRTRQAGPRGHVFEPTSSASERNASVAIRYSGGTLSGCSPRVM